MVGFAVFEVVGVGGMVVGVRTDGGWRPLFLKRLRRCFLSRCNFWPRGDWGVVGESVCVVAGVWFRFGRRSLASSSTGPLWLKTSSVVGSGSGERVPSKNLERETGGGVAGFGACRSCQYFSANARLCLSVR